jgi:methionyl-tRNA formyltransferase
MAGVIFFGSPDFAVPSLTALCATPYRPVLAVSQPDRPAGRGKSVTPTPVRTAAESKGVPVMVLPRFDDGDAMERLRSLDPDYFVVVAFGLIFPPAALRIARSGNINVHASLLPSYRGASPIQRAIVDGRSTTGVTPMEMAAAVDAGPIYLQREIVIDRDDDAGSLSGKLAELGGRLLVETLTKIDAGTLTARPQPEAGVTFAPRLKKNDGLVPWELDAESVHNHIRGMNPWPGSFTYLDGTYIKIHRAAPIDEKNRAGAPGTVVAIDDRGILVACGRGTVVVSRLQAEGRRPLDAADFLQGSVLDVGAVFGS